MQRRIIALGLALAFGLLSTTRTSAQDRGAASGELAWSIGFDPATLDPAKVDDQASETVRYLTGGVLVRLNRSTLSLEPALAESWALSPDGRLVTFHLRKGLRFSDGSPLTSNDVAVSPASASQLVITHRGDWQCL